MANGVDQNYAAASPNDPDLGEQAILQRVEKYEPFTVEVGTPFYYTSNVALVDRGRVDDLIIAPVAEITFAPKFGKTLYGEFSVRQQFFVTTTTPASTSPASMCWPGWFIPSRRCTTSPCAQMSTTTGSPGRITSTISSRITPCRRAPSSRSRSDEPSRFPSAWTQTVSLYANPEPPRRNDFGAYVGYVVNISRSFSLDAAGRVVVRAYDSRGRTDVSEVLAFSANYRLRDYLTLSAISTFVANQSNQSVFN